MRSLEIPNLPDELYDQIEKLARVRGRSVSEVAAEFLVKGVSGGEAADAKLMADIRAERDEMAKRGVCVTEEGVREGKNWGRE